MCSVKSLNRPLIVNPIDLPGFTALVTTHQKALIQLQIPFRAGPRGFIPPIAGKQIRAALIRDFAVNFAGALNMHWNTFRHENGRSCGRAKSA